MATYRLYEVNDQGEPLRPMRKDALAALTGGPPVDPRTVTGAWYVARGKYGKRPHDRPVWWVICYHLAKAIAQVIVVLGGVAAAGLSARCGLHPPGVH